MPVPSHPELLGRLEPLTHAERERTMAELGRDHRGDEVLGTLLDRLLAGSTAEACWALRSAIAAHDTARVVASAADPRVRVRSLAVTHLVEAGADDDTLRALIDRASTADRRRLLRVIARHGRHDLADGLVDELRARWGDRDATRLLPTCSDATVRRVLPEVAHAVVSWSSLARSHPDLVLEHIEVSVSPLRGADREVAWLTVGRAAAAVSRARPDEVLALLERAGPASGVPVTMAGELSRLVRHDPSRTMALVLAPMGRAVERGVLPTGVVRAAAALPHAERVRAARVVRDDPWALAALLARFAPSERGAVFTEAFDDVDTTATVWAPTLLEVLPRGIRVGEARRILDLPQVTASPELARTYEALLPFDEALTLLEPTLAARTGEERAPAYRLLTVSGCLARDPDALTAVLERLQRVRNEQDPVRHAALGALTRLPAHLVGPAHVALLDALVTAAVESRDTSHATVYALTEVEVKVLAGAAPEPDGPVFTHALSALERLAGADGSLHLGRLDRRLRRGDEHRVVAALARRLHDDADRDRYRLALALAAALGRRAWAVPELQAVLERGALTLRTSADAQAVIDRWLTDPSTRGERVGRLVAADASVVALAPVRSAIATRRQDLVDLLVSTRRIRGRFLSGGVRTVPILTRGPATWLPRQQRAYAAALRALVDDPATATWTRMAAIRALARIPDVGAEALIALVDDGDVVVAEAALGGLPWTDRPEGALDLLLARAGSEHARVAVYAAARSARFASPAVLAGAVSRLLDDPDSKVTARKEAVRILGANRAPASVDLLLALCERQWHRDVTMALGRTVRDLDDPRAGALLDRLAAGTADEARSLLDTDPDALPPALRTAFAERVVRIAEHDDPTTRSAALGALGRWARWASEPAADVAARQVLDPARSSTWDRAASALVRMAGDGRGVDRLDEVLVALASRDARAEADALADRDVPSRQRLVAVVDALGALDEPAAAGLRPDLRRWADGLSTDPSTLALAAALEVRAVDWDDLSAGLLAVAARVAEVPVVAAAVASPVHNGLVRNRRRWSPSELVAAVDALVADDRPGSRQLAAALVGPAGEATGWDDASRALLRRLRDAAASDPAVATVLVRVVTARE